MRTSLFAMGILLLAACGTDDPVGPGSPYPEPVSAVEVRCAADILGGTLTCTRPGPQSTREIVGGQGTVVVLRSANVAAAAGLFQADVDIQNVGAQLLGTTDGTTADSIFVFFVSGPSVTAGTGAVSVANADGTGTFTAAGQAYFAYDTILGSLERSAARQWQWNYDPTVTSFSFTVLVAAAVPHLGGFLRWRQVLGTEVQVTPEDVAANGEFDVMVTSSGGGVYVRSATGWTSYAAQLPGSFSGVAGLGNGAYLGVTTSYSATTTATVASFQGGSWRTLATFPNVFLSEVAVGGANAWFVGGADDTGADACLITFDGIAWTTQTYPGRGRVVALAATAADRAIALTSSGYVMWWNGTAWSDLAAGGTDPNFQYSTIAITGDREYLVGGGVNVGFGTDARVIRGDTLTADTVYADAGSQVERLLTEGTDVLALMRVGGGFMTPASSVLRLYDGATWTTSDSTAGVYFGMVRAATERYYLLNESALALWDGAGVTPVLGPGGSPAEFNGIAALGDTIFIADQAGNVRRFDGTAWTSQSVSSQGLEGVAALASDDIYAGGQEGVFHYDGVSWSLVPGLDPGAYAMAAIGGHVFVAYSGNVAVFDGVTWQQFPTVPASGYFTSFYGTSATDVYASGYEYNLWHWDGAAWTRVTLPVLAPGDSSSRWLPAVGGDGTGKLWVISDGGAALYFDGSSWSSVTGGPESSSGGAVVSLGANSAFLLTSDAPYWARGSAARQVGQADARADAGAVQTSDGRLWVLGSGSLAVGER